MKVSREAFFQSLLQHNSDELLSKAKGLLSRLEAEPVNTPVSGPSRVKGLPDSIDPNHGRQPAPLIDHWSIFSNNFLKSYKTIKIS